MASGLMTLAYLGEMAIVFNLAYLELSKERYLKQPKDEIAILLNEITSGDRGAVDKSTWIKGTTNLSDRLVGMTSSIPKSRQHAWYVSRSEDMQANFTWWAGPAYNFFSNEWDKLLCQRALIIGALLLIAITILDNFELSKGLLQNRDLVMATFLIVATLVWLGWLLDRQLSRKAALWGCLLLSFSIAAHFGSVPGFDFPRLSIAYWWYFFVFFLLSLLSPVACILLGRGVRAKFRECILDSKSEFETLKEKQLPKNGA